MAQDFYGRRYDRDFDRYGRERDWRANERGWNAAEERSFGRQDRDRYMDRRQAEEISRNIGEGEWGWQARPHHHSHEHHRHEHRGHDHHGRGGRGFLDRAKETMESWFSGDEPDRAGDRERRFDRADHRGRGPKGYRRSDDRIHDDACDRLTVDPWIDASDVEVRVFDAEVTLTGFVDSREDKRRAEDLVDSIPGVEQVQNNLRVRRREDMTMTRAGEAEAEPEPVIVSGAGADQEAAQLLARANRTR